MAWQVCSSFSAQVVPLAGCMVLAHTVSSALSGLGAAHPIDGKGLTSFKIQAENAGVAVCHPPSVSQSGGCAIPAPSTPLPCWVRPMRAESELFFTMYAHVTDVYNLAGHLTKIGAYYLLYQVWWSKPSDAPTLTSIPGCGWLTRRGAWRTSASG